MKPVLAFLRFWYDFVVGDDWRVAVAVIAALGVTAALAGSGIPAWWTMPVAVVAILLATLRRASRCRRAGSHRRGSRETMILERSST
jgi:hypothetical protein